ncbi:restriction endonuclease subunit S [Candidatus Latescibacterota bacterium]
MASLNPKKSEVRGLSPETEVSFLPMASVGELGGGLSLEATRALGDALEGYTYFRDGDVVFAKITPCFENGKGALAEGLTNHIGLGTTELTVLRPGSALDKRFLFYITQSDHFRKIGAGAMYGAGGQKRVPEQFARDLRHAMPPLDEQRAIVDFLDRETAKIDALVAKKERLIELLQEKRTALTTHAVTKGLNPDAPMKSSGVEWLGDVPAHWGMTFLDKVTDPVRRITYGIVQPGLPDPGGRFMVRGQDYSRGWARPETVFRVSEQIEVPYRRARLRPGDIVMTIVGAGTGNVAVVPTWLDGANITQTTARIAVSDREGHYPFFALLLESRVGRTNVELTAKGAAQPGINLGHLAKYRVPVPPLAEQIEISTYLQAQITAIEGLTAKVQEAIERLKEFRAALISAAVTGKIDVRQEVA